MMKLMLLTADPAFAAQAQDAGVDRIFLDLEYINKIERQMGRNTVISHNSVDDVAKLRRVLDRSDLLVRVNPINPSLKAEVDRVIADGADIVMGSLWSLTRTTPSGLSKWWVAGPKFACCWKPLRHLCA